MFEYIHQTKVKNNVCLRGSILKKLYLKLSILKHE